jgi:hypothetical protein
MNKAQRLLIMVTLIAIGFALACIMLQWDNEWGFEKIRILVFYADPDPKYPNLTNHWGFYTAYGIPGVLLGVVAPLVLFASAAYLWLGTPKEPR